MHCLAARRIALLIVACGILQFSVCVAHAADDLGIAEKEKAIAELERQRRQLAEKELARNRQEQQQLEARLEDARRQLTATFELDERHLIPRPQRISKTLARLQHQRDTTKFSLLQFRDQARGSISRGVALNFFLSECGAVAFDHDFYTTVMQPKNQVQIAQVQLLKDVADAYKLTKETTRHIRYTKGLLGSKLTGRINQGPLDLNWPSVLRQDSFKDSREKIEKLRDQAVAELDQGQPVTAATADSILKEIERLVIAIRKEKKVQIKKSDGVYQKVDRYYVAERFSELLAAGAYRLIEGFSLGDVTFEKFNEGNIEQLLAFMYRNNLTFAEADANGESAYFIMFEMMARYYVDLHALKLAIAEDENSLVELKSEEDAMRSVALGKTMNAMQKFELGKSALGALSGMVSAYEARQKRKAVEALTGRGK